MSKAYKYQIKVNAIDYCVEDEDVCDLVDVKPEYTTSWYDAIDTKIEEIKSSLPQTMELEIECEEEDLADQVVNVVSDITGWLNNSVDYQVISKKQVW